MDVDDLGCGVDVLGCPVVGRGPDLPLLLGTQVGVVAADHVGIDVGGDEDAPVWVPAGNVQRRVLAGDAEDPAQGAPDAYGVVRVLPGQWWAGCDFQLGVDGTQGWGVVWVAGCFSGPAFGVGDGPGDGLFAAFGDGTVSAATDPGDGGADAGGPGQSGLDQHGVGEPVKVRDLASVEGHPVRGARGPRSAHRAKYARGSDSRAQGRAGRGPGGTPSAYWLLPLHPGGDRPTPAGPCLGRTCPGPCTRTEPSLRDRCAALDKSPPTLGAAVYRVRGRCGAGSCLRLDVVIVDVDAVECWILGTGGRGFRSAEDRLVVRAAFVAVQEKVGLAGPRMGVVHGQAYGADLLIDSVGTELGWVTDPVPCSDEEWARWGKSAGHRRNERMIARRRYRGCVAFPRGLSAGTRGCMVAAGKARIRVWNRGDPPLPDGCYQVTQGGTCAGFEVMCGLVVRCAPRLRADLAMWWDLAATGTSKTVVRVS